MNIDTPEGRAELRKLCEAAIPGGWHLLHDAPDSPNKHCDCAQVWCDEPGGWPVAFCDTQDDGEGFTREKQMANAAFIAAARTALPAALDRIEKLEAELADAEGRIEAAKRIVEEIKEDLRKSTARNAP